MLHREKSLLIIGIEQLIGGSCACNVTFLEYYGVTDLTKSVQQEATDAFLTRDYKEF